MKVTNQDLTGLGATSASRTQETQKSSAGAAGSSSKSASGGDSVNFSSGLGSLSRAMSSFDAGSSVRVQALSSQYQAGSYIPDSAATSRGMISDALSQ
jgi:anti-sigma28 factor (negative regulator of flagellin synthesis)